MANPFDRFDTGEGSNPFDEFDSGTSTAVAESPSQLPEVTPEAIATGAGKPGQAELTARRDKAAQEAARWNTAVQVTEPATPAGMLNLPNRIASQLGVKNINPAPFQAGVPVLGAIPHATDIRPGTVAGVAAGVYNTVADTLNSLQTPEGIVTAPAAGESALVRAIFAGQMVKDVPEQAKEAIKTFRDPNSTITEKTEAVGKPLVSTLMATGLTFPEATKAATRAITKAVIPDSLKTSTEGVPNAPQERQVQESVQPERQAGDGGGQTAEAGSGNRVQPAAGVEKEAQVPLKPLSQRRIESLTGAGKKAVDEWVKAAREKPDEDPHQLPEWDKAFDAVAGLPEGRDLASETLDEHLESQPPKTPAGASEAQAVAGEAQPEKTPPAGKQASVDTFIDDFNEGKRLSTHDAVQTGLKVKSVEDLDALAKARLDEIVKSKKLAQEARTENNPQKFQESMAAGFRAQIPREAIETALNAGSHVEGEGKLIPTKYGERPLDWSKNPEAAQWLTQNADKLGIALPDELANKVETTPLDPATGNPIEPVQKPPAKGELVGMGAATPSEFSDSGSGRDSYGIAERVRQRMAQTGEGPVVPRGVGISAPDSVIRGRQLLSSGIDPEQTISNFEKTRRLSADDMAVVRAQGEKLRQNVIQTERKSGTDSKQYRDAFKQWADWDTRSKVMQTEWHKTGQAQQGETDIDTGTFTGLQQAWYDATGKEFTPPQAAKARKIAGNVTAAADATDAAQSNLQQQLELELGKVDVPPPKNLDEARQLFSKYQKGSKFTQQQVKTLWNVVRKFYMEKGETDFDNIRHGLASDLGLPVDDVTKALSQNKTVKRASDELYKRMSDERRLRDNAKNWIKNEQTPGWIRFIKNVPRVFFLDKIFGHGTTGMVTHAGINVFNPDAWSTYFPNFVRQFGLQFNKAYHERVVQDLLRDPNFIAAKRAGLANDPYRYQDDYQNATMKSFMDKLGPLVGGRGFDALKTFRQARFNQEWNRAPESLRTPEYAQVLADAINHSTGVTRSRFGNLNEAANVAFFAPRLEASRWAWMVKDPARASKIFTNWKNEAPANRQFAVSQLKEKALVAGTLYALLQTNQGILKAMGSKQKINLTDPRKSDFLAFKVGGQNVGIISPMLGMVRLFANLYHDAFQERTRAEKKDTRAKEAVSLLGQYGRGKLSPFTSDVTDVAFRSDIFGRPLPNETERTPRKFRKQGAYTWPEYAEEKLAPIPAEEAIREVWTDQGMPQKDQNALLDALLTGVVAGSTGARISKDTTQQ